MKNILVVLGGGRPNGNTKQLVDAFAKGAMDAGHNENANSAPVFSLNKYLYIKTREKGFLLVLIHFRLS